MGLSAAAWKRVAGGAGGADAGGAGWLRFCDQVYVAPLIGTGCRKMEAVGSECRRYSHADAMNPARRRCAHMKGRTAGRRSVSSLPDRALSGSCRQPLPADGPLLHAGRARRINAHYIDFRRNFATWFGRRSIWAVRQNLFGGDVVLLDGLADARFASRRNTILARRQTVPVCRRSSVVVFLVFHSCSVFRGIKKAIGGGWRSFDIKAQTVGVWRLTNCQVWGIFEA